LLLLLSCAAKKEAKKAALRLIALRVSSSARKNGRALLLHPVSSLASAVSQSGKFGIKERVN